MRGRRDGTPLLQIAGAAALLVVGLVTGCHGPDAGDRARVSQDVVGRTGYAVGAGPRADRVLVPDGLDAGRPLTEDEAVVVALWNNAAFHEALVELDLTRADLIQAGLLPNPEVFYSWPVPDRVFRYLFDFPVESLLLRPFRLKVATAENDRACAKVTQLGLDLIRDTRQAHSDLRLAEDQVLVAARAVELRGGIVKLVETRLAAGDASQLEVSTARIDALQAEQDLARARGEVAAVAEKLRNLTGLSDMNIPLSAADLRADTRTGRGVDDLVAEAVATRPDVVATAHAARAAAERVRVARIGWLRVLAVADATSGNPGNTLGPGVRATLPIFNQGQGMKARAGAERDQLEARRLTVHNQVVQDVRAAFARYEQARSELDIVRTKTRPEVEATIRRAEVAYKEGNATFLIVLEANRQLVTALAREAQLSADLRRAWAELERAVGRRLAPPSPPAAEPAPR
ncbi:TolC family protein [bacterium]|nr:TolC family protein [bacterium]